METDARLSVVDWRALASALVLSCVGILVRHFGRRVPFTSNEAMFYGSHTFALFVAVTISSPLLLPGQLINEDGLKRDRDKEQSRKKIQSGQGDIDEASIAETEELPVIEITGSEVEKIGV